MSMKEWLKNNKAPPQKVFDYLNKTSKLRRVEILKCRNQVFTAVIDDWPRLFDTPGAVSC